MNDLFFDALTVETQTQETSKESNVVMINSKPSQEIKTRLFTISFEHIKSMSYMVHAGQFFTSMLFDVIANKLIIQIVEYVLQIQLAVTGPVVTTSNNPVPIYHMFDLEGSLLPEFCLPNVDKNKVESLFALADAHIKAIDELKAEKIRFLPAGKNELQLAYDFSEKGRKITDPKEAIAYHKVRTKTYTDAQALVEAARRETPTITTPTVISAEKMLGY